MFPSVFSDPRICSYRIRAISVYVDPVFSPSFAISDVLQLFGFVIVFLVRCNGGWTWIWRPTVIDIDTIDFHAVLWCYTPEADFNRLLVPNLWIWFGVPTHKIYLCPHQRIKNFDKYAQVKHCVCSLVLSSSSKEGTFFLLQETHLPPPAEAPSFSCRRSTFPFFQEKHPPPPGEEAPCFSWKRSAHQGWTRIIPSHHPPAMQSMREQRVNRGWTEGEQRLNCPSASHRACVNTGWTEGEQWVNRG